MSRRFTFTQCITLLHTNSKTFLKWLAEDGIDASKQIDPADPRRKYVTEEHLISIAKKREIDLHLPDPDRKPESTSARILAGIDERFAKLEQQMVERFDQLAAEIPTMLADLRHHLEQQLTHHFDQLDAHLAQMLAEPQRAHASAPPQERPPTQACGQKARETQDESQKASSSLPCATRHLQAAPQDLRESGRIRD